MNPFQQFYKDVNMNSRKDMIAFLQNHFRYNLMNSWNQTTSYANNIKIQNLYIPETTKNTFYNMLNVDDIYDIDTLVLSEFMYRYNGRYQIDRNGRSGGYLVLYNGYKKQSDYKSHCTNCGQMNFTEATKTNCTCGKCGQNTRVNFSKPIYNYGVTFQNIDQNADFENWETDQLLAHVKLVQDFDKTCDLYIQNLIQISEDYEIIEQTIYVPKTKSVLVKK